jgi:hypothetical protein
VGVKVTARDGREWEVSRGIRWPRLRERGSLDWLDFPTTFDTGDLGGVLAVIAIVLLLTVLVVVLLPFLVFLLELVVVVVASLILRRAWVVTARSLGPSPEVREWRVRGFLRSRAAVREVADELRRGVTAEPEHAEAGA